RVCRARRAPRGASVVPGDPPVLWASSQSAHRARAQLEQMLGREVRVRVPDVGGGFGAKGSLRVEAAVVALAAERLGRPVKWIDDGRGAPQARGVRGSLELALDRDG